ncbi:hypothetical protein A3K63_04830 [Candidatus Micrarchaeota archaeon RBG_16_49_10]|nr:MAG: hypothetical protein A3K63_04830 [Candidatus Micrarchaeota archaeon RBG_16_49_10]
MRKMRPVKKIAFAVLIAFAVICFWRGGWGLVDHYLLPQNKLLSYWTSLFIGLFILIVTHYATKELM